MFKRFTSLLTLALLLVTGVFTYVQTTETADAASSIAYYVDYSSHYSFMGTNYPREYQYSASNAPKSSWGTVKKPFVGIASAMDAAAHHGHKAVTVYYCTPTTSTGTTFSWNARVNPYTSKKLDVYIKPYPRADRSKCAGGKSFDSTHEFKTNNYKTLSIKGFKQELHSHVFVDAVGADVKLENWDRFYGYSTVKIENAKSISFKNNRVVEHSTGGADLLFESADGDIWITNNTFEVSSTSGSVGGSTLYSDYSAIFVLGAPNGKIYIQNNRVEDYQMVVGGNVGVISGNDFEFTQPYTSPGGPIITGQLSFYGGIMPTTVSEIRNNSFKSFEKAPILVDGDVQIQSIFQNSFENTRPSTPSDAAIVQQDEKGSLGNIIENDFLNYSRGVLGIYANDVLKNEFRAPSLPSGGSLAHVTLVGDANRIAENRFFGGSSASSETGLALAPTNGFTSYYASHLTDPMDVVGVDSNEFKDLDAAIVVSAPLPAGVTVRSISHNDMDNVKRGIFVDDATVERISSNRMDGSQFGIHCAIDCVIEDIGMNEIDNFPHSIEIDAGEIWDIHQNRFTDYQEGIFIEAYVGMVEDYETADSFPTVTHNHYTTIRENEFINQEWGDTVAIKAAGNGEMGDIKRNRYQYTEQFLVSYGELEWGDVTHNEYLSSPTTIPGGSHSVPAVFVDAGTARFLENFFHLPSGAVYDTVYDFRDAALEVAYHNDLKSNDIGVYYSGSGPYSTARANVRIFDNQFDAPTAVLVDGASSFDKDIEITRNGFLRGAQYCVRVEDLRAGRDVLVRDNVIEHCPNGVYALRSDMLLVERNFFRSIASGVYSDSSGITGIIANDFVNVDYPITIDQGRIPEIAANRIDSSVIAVELDNTDWDANIYFHNNVIARSRNEAVKANNVGTRSTTDAFFLFNTFDENGTDLDLRATTGVFYTVANNIFTDQSYGVPVDLPLSALDYDVSNNLFRSLDPENDIAVMDSGDVYTLEELEAFCSSSAGPCPYHHDNEYDSNASRPTFTGYNYKPNYDSYAIDNASAAYTSMTSDVTGNARLIGGNPDIGAFERSLSYDTDGDGLWDEAEVAWGSDILTLDSDGDGDNDGDEVLYLHQDPSVADVIDTDGDGMSDTYEDLFGLDKNDASDASDDNDGDGATNLEEYAYWFSGGEIVSPIDSDSDGDGIDDGWEIQAADACGISYVDPSTADASNDVDADGLNNNDEYSEGTNPCSDDTDSDALNDGDEVNTHGTDPLDPDTDGDGLTDGEEINGTYGVVTDALDIDTDSDGLSDYEELVIYASTYTGPDAPLDPTVDDTDGDGYSDGLEVNSYSTDPTDASDFPADADGDGMDDVWEDLYACVDSSVADASDDDDLDGLTHLEEASYGTDPCSDDTDSDGLTDGEELVTYSTTYTCLDATVADSDVDGLDDGDEVNTHGTDPCDTDSDGDGLDDGDEVNTYGTDPLDIDTDSDGLSDYEELVTYASTYSCLDATVADSDVDGLDDGDEVNTHGSSPCLTDTDSDTISDADEVSEGTDPALADTDGDTYDDATDLFPLDSTEWADTDGDGVGDNSDLCAGTPSGASVDSNGCADTDGDGLSDADEIGVYGTDETLADTDGDGLNDYEEVITYASTGVSATVADTDADGLNDYEEVITYASTYTCLDPADDDSDADGLNDGDEVNTHGSSPCLTDTDSDGLDDIDEVNTYGTDPSASDSDADGLSDYEELVTYASTYTGPYGPLDPNDSDTDGDNLNDGDEVNSYGTDPTDTNSDDDGLSDYQELVTYASTYSCLDPNVADSDGDALEDGPEINTYGTNPCLSDMDGDSLTDGEEINGDYGYVTDPTDSDSDDDGLDDGEEELVYSTDPNDEDSDDDGLTDYAEVITYASSNWSTLGWTGADMGTATYLDPNDDDSDGDTVSDGDEVTYGTDPTDSSSYSLDADGDGVVDSLDLCPGTPSGIPVDSDGCAYDNVDTDGDGFTDAYEVDQATSPTSSSDYPTLIFYVASYEQLEGYGTDSSTWNDISTSYTSARYMTLSDISTEDMYVSSYLSLRSGHLFGVQWDETQFMGSVQGFSCGAGSNSDDNGATKTCTTSVSSTSSPTYGSTMTSAGYTLADWEWFEPGSGSYDFQFMKIRFTP